MPEAPCKLVLFGLGQGRKSAELARERYKLRSQRREQTLKVVSQAARGDSLAFDPIVFDVDCIVLTNAEVL
jgi:hypothetical protein